MNKMCKRITKCDVEEERSRLPLVPTILANTSITQGPTNQTHLTLETSKSDSPIITEEQDDASSKTELWNWQKDGYRFLASGGKRQHYRCSSKKSTGCPARKYVDTLPTGDTVYSNGKKHNHPPPKKRKIAEEIRQEAKCDLQAGATPNQVLKKIVLATSDPSNVPTLKQLSNWKSYMKRSTLPSSDYIQNILSVFGDSFVLHFAIYPNVTLILATQEGLSILQKSKYLLIDGTFNLCEEELQLVTLMAVIEEDIGIPAAFMLSNCKNTETYTHFISVVKENCPNKFLDPVAVLGDFEEALESAVHGVLTNSTWYSDYFHFIQTNTRWLKKHDGNEDHTTILVPHLRILYQSNNADELYNNLTRFGGFWMDHHPSYWDYFKRNFGSNGLHPPAKWARYSRPVRIPSGDQMLEEWHFRLKSSFMMSKQNPIDHVVQQLHNEWLYYSKIIASQDLLYQKWVEVGQKRAQYQRQLTLSDYISQEGSARIQLHAEALPLLVESVQTATEQTQSGLPHRTSPNPT